VRQFRLPVLVSLAFTAWAPFIGEIRSALLRAFPGTFLKALALSIGATVGLAIAIALWRIRDRRPIRYASVAAGVALFVWYVVRFSTGNPSVDVVERFHFVEYGLIAFLFYRAFARGPYPSGRWSTGAVLLMALLCGFLAGIAEEFVQWVVPGRTGEVRDVFLNLYALTAGLLFSAGVVTPHVRPATPSRMSVAPVLALLVVVIVALGWFFDCAHLGHELHDHETGTFRSYFTRDELLALQRQRGEEWRRDPPRRLNIIGMEDFYMTEAGWRVQERNRAHDRGDFAAAWKENRTLEKYYAPFLDLASFMTGKTHRWPAEQRLNVEALARERPDAPYVSRAGEDRIVTSIDRRMFWLAVIGLAAPFSAGAYVAARRVPAPPKKVL
jgi:hypothetical protein